MYNVAIIGAGPAGIFAALEIMKLKPDWKVVLIEKGQRIEKRKCPIREGSPKCVNCKRCGLLCGWGGAGAFSDGAEACTHAPLSEDIGRVKLPRLLRKRIGEKLQIDIVGGTDFPQDLTPYSLVIHCGACMFNRKYVLSRIELARKQNIPMTNYGVAIAFLNGILDRIEY